MNILSNKLLMIILGFTLAPMAALAMPVVDQNQASAQVDMADFSQGGLAQSFQQSANNISGAGIFLLQNRGSTDLVTIFLYDALPNASGNLLASGSAQGTQGSWVDIFWSAINIVPDTTYYLVFTSANNTLSISGDVSNPYSRGNVFANSGFGTFPAYDYAFRTYSSNTTQSVPEPAPLALLGLGLLGLGFARKRRV